MPVLQGWGCTISPSGQVEVQGDGSERPIVPVFFFFGGCGSGRLVEGDKPFYPVMIVTYIYIFHYIFLLSHDPMMPWGCNVL